MFYRKVHILVDWEEIFLLFCDGGPQRAAESKWATA